ncbi:MAG: hypothetical protein NTX19_01440 [Gemmatimonadetes bacterium]|nr:hypothetical protein [Gemmatimonadota bacterium]
MRKSNRVQRTLALSAIVLLAGGCSNPRQAAYLNEQLNQAADAVGDIRANLSLLQSSIDSLRVVIAKQDTTIARMAAVTNVSVVK